MRLINGMIMLILLALPVMWVSVLSVSIYQSVAAVYRQADRIAFSAAFH